MKENRGRLQAKGNRQRGFSTLELLIVVSISLVMAAITIPGYNSIRRAMRLNGDVRNLNGTINQAKVQAAADFTRARVFADLAANTFHIETWNRAGGVGGAGCWQTLDDPNNPCTVAGLSPVHPLSLNVTFGIAGVAAAPPNTQAVFGQAPPCPGFANSACVIFSSRGMPIDNAGLPVGTSNALYITDNERVLGVTLGPTGLSQVWGTSANGNAPWSRR